MSAEVAQALRDDPTDTDAIWSAAVLDLWTAGSDDRPIDRAIRRLAEVEARLPDDARVLNHLAIAYAARAERKFGAIDLYRAFDLALRAYERDSTDAAIRFNRAATLSLVQALHQARGAWQQVARDERSSWGDEARRRARDILRAEPSHASSDAIERTKADLQWGREYVLDSLLLGWSRAERENADTSAHVLAASIARIGETISSAHGDSTVSHIARELAVDRSADDRQALARAIDAYSTGVARYRLAEFEVARVRLEEAARDFTRLRAPTLAGWSRLMLGVIAMGNNDFSRARREIGELVEFARDRDDVALRARALTALALTEGRAGNLAASRAEYLEAITLFQEIGESRNAATLAPSLGEVLEGQGRLLDAADITYAGIVERAKAAGEVRYEDLVSLAQRLLERSLVHAARAMIVEAVEQARGSPRAKDLPESLGRLAMIESALGNTEAARLALGEARSSSNAVRDSSMRARLQAELDRAEASVVGGDAPRQALPLIDRARAFFGDIPLDDVALLLQRVELSLALGDSLAAERDLASASGIATRIAQPEAPQYRRALASAHRTVQETLIELALARGDTALAFRRTEGIGSEGGSPTSRLSHAEGELWLVPLRGRVVTWLRTERSLRVAKVPGTRSELATRVGRFVNLLRAGEDTVAIARVAQELYRDLVAPHTPALAPLTSLRVHLAGELARLPVGVLRDPSGRWLLERVTVRIMDSPTSAPTVARRGKTAPYVPLLVGDPAWNRAQFPELDRLRGSRDEIARIRGMYPDAHVLDDTAATRDAVLASLARYPVFHFAGHARVVTSKSELSHLVLATNGMGVEGQSLYASDIAALPLRGMQLAILSSCGIVGEVEEQEDQVNGLVRAFLDAGARAVISGLWEVDDALTPALMEELHRGLRAGMDPAEALRAAQVALLRSGRRGALMTVGPFVVSER